MHESLTTGLMSGWCHTSPSTPASLVQLETELRLRDAFSFPPNLPSCRACPAPLVTALVTAPFVPLTAPSIAFDTLIQIASKLLRNETYPQMHKPVPLRNRSDALPLDFQAVAGRDVPMDLASCSAKGAGDNALMSMPP